MISEIDMVATKKKPGRPTLGTESDFRRFGKSPRVGLHGWDIYDAREQLLLPINQMHVDNAKPRVAGECVVALATSDFFSDKYDVEVKLTVVHVVDQKNKKMLRFHLPAALRQRLRMFDKKSKWTSPLGLYCLYPMKAKKKKRPKTVTIVDWRKATTKGVGGKTVIAPRPSAKRKKKIAAPTRVVSRGKLYKRPLKSLVR